MPSTTSLLPGARSAQAVLLALLPHGGQQHARRNAWIGMSAGAARGRERRQVEAALSDAEQRAYAQQTLRGGSAT